MNDPKNKNALTVFTKHHNKYNRSLKFWNTFFEFHKRSTKKWIISKNPQYSIMCGIFFHRFGVGVNTEPWEPENTPSCPLWRNGRLRVTHIRNIFINWSSIMKNVSQAISGLPIFEDNFRTFKISIWNYSKMEHHILIWNHLFTTSNKDYVRST